MPQLIECWSTNPKGSNPTPVEVFGLQLIAALSIYLPNIQFRGWSTQKNNNWCFKRCYWIINESSHFSFTTNYLPASFFWYYFPQSLYLFILIRYYTHCCPQSFNLFKLLGDIWSKVKISKTTQAHLNFGFVSFRKTIVKVGFKSFSGFHHLSTG